MPPLQPESSTSPFHVLQSCVLGNTSEPSKRAAARCLNDESPVHCLWNASQSLVMSSINSSTSRAMVTSLSATSSRTATRAELANAHNSLRQDWNLSSLIWNVGDASFRGWKITDIRTFKYRQFDWMHAMWLIEYVLWSWYRCIFYVFHHYIWNLTLPLKSLSCIFSTYPLLPNDVQHDEGE